MTTRYPQLPGELTAAVLARLGLGRTAEPTLQGLKAIYGAWCRKIAFDNLRKLIHLQFSPGTPLPGNDPVSFFQDWLQHGIGGTCWAGSEALYALLHSLGYQVRRGLATMQVAPDEPPNHGTTIVLFHGCNYLVDTSLLHQRPLGLHRGPSCSINHPAWGITGHRVGHSWEVQWRPLHMLNGCRCHLDSIGVSREIFAQGNERTRRWGPFNYSVYTRINRGDAVIGLAYGHGVTIDGQGRIRRVPVTPAESRTFLVEEMGYSAEIVRQLPPDRPTPPPPRLAPGIQGY